ncbi:MAG: YjdF family protein [Clostridia bacterium]|nr:YjdF family protein [Clostridia bacterium]
MQSKLTVFFEEPFWVGIFERSDGKHYSVAKVTFGAEPSDAQIEAFILKHYNTLPFTRALKAPIKHSADNPKRRQREARKALETPFRGTKAQQALQQEYEQNKAARKQRAKARKDAEKEKKFTLKQEKKKQKHKGH